MVAPAKAQAAAQQLAASGIHGDFVMVCPFAAGRAATADKAEKKWPGFADFVHQGASRLKLPLVVYPGPGEHKEARALYPAAQMLDGLSMQWDELRVPRNATCVVCGQAGRPAA